MPGLTAEHLPELIEQNRRIGHEVELLIKRYLLQHFPKGWGIVEGTKKWLEDTHHLLQAPIQDESLGGFICFQSNRHICYVNTWHPRVYQHFMLLHELYHLLADSGMTTQQPLHMVEPDLDERMNIEERKADYFASLLLIDGGVLRHLVTSLQAEKDLEHIVFQCMVRFEAPYKAILIRMHELGLLDPTSLRNLFDRNYDFAKMFEKHGLDPACIERNNLIKFGKLEEWMQGQELPETAQTFNLETFQAVKHYFEQQKG